ASSRTSSRPEYPVAPSTPTRAIEESYMVSGIYSSAPRGQGSGRDCGGERGAMDLVADACFARCGGARPITRRQGRESIVAANRYAVLRRTGCGGTAASARLDPGELLEAPGDGVEELGLAEDD